MNLSNYLQIFRKTYTRRRKDFDLSENEIVELLENRYPQPLPSIGCPVLRDRIEKFMAELSREDRPEEETFLRRIFTSFIARLFLSISCLASMTCGLRHCLPSFTPTLERNTVSPMILIRYSAWLNALSISG